MRNLLQTEIKQFGISKTCGIGADSKCCKIYVKSINRCGLAAEKAYALAYPEVSKATWARYAAMGRGQVCPEMGLGAFSARKCLERLSVARQRKLILEGTMVYYKHEEPHKVPAMKMCPLTVNQVFIKGPGPLKMRGLAAQEVWREAYEATAKKSSEPYNIRNGLLWIRDAKGRPYPITLTTLRAPIIPTMEAQIAEK